MTVETTHSWRPVLEGAPADRASEAIRAIAAQLRDPPSNNASLAFGHAGLAVLYDYLPPELCSFDSDQVSERYLDLAIDGVASQPMSASFFPGFSGVAWAVEHLRASGASAANEDANSEIDEALRMLLERSPWTGPYELTGGLVGIGVYALERLPRPIAADCLRAVVDRLEDLSERHPEGIAWRTLPRFLTLATPQQCPNGYFDLGLAHGVPGVISILAAAARSGIASEKSRQMLHAASRWLWAHTLGPEKASTLPPMASSELPRRASRAAWCYGDPGVAASLVAAADAVADADLMQRAVELAQRVAARPLEQCGVDDAPLCHGAAGLGHIFNRLFQSTGRVEFADAARDWFSRALKMRHPGEGIGGFQAAEKRAGGELDWVSDPSLLTGAAGIALALIAATTSVEPAWDRMLLLSLRSVQS